MKVISLDGIWSEFETSVMFLGKTLNTRRALVSTSKWVPATEKTKSKSLNATELTKALVVWDAWPFAVLFLGNLPQLLYRTVFSS